ncbi:unnamed protein product [Schistosoma mattheei]|uniref:Uncharacterized protein n=1 Tax=Schistosoma mattheei TaxID=31246 RepID=A0A3P8KYR1_9TREM|nr:unnamed protein product [Schistosoma mattheei]
MQLNHTDHYFPEYIELEMLRLAGQDDNRYQLKVSNILGNRVGVTN